MQGVSETAVEWRKSRASGTSECVEVARSDGDVLIRDSKRPQGAVLRFTPGEWEAFLLGVRDGEFDFVRLP